MRGMKQNLVSDTNWTVEATGMLVCPHGNRVEDDGTCPRGCVSPLLEIGMI